jgi:hypothetical protein
MACKVKMPKLKKNSDQLETDLAIYGLKIANAKQALLQACVIANKMSKKGNDVIEQITDGKKKKWVADFNRNTTLRKWFGKAEKKSHVKDVRNRMRSVNKRIGKGLTLRLRPQKGRTLNAQNYGTFFDPKTFKVFPQIFDGSINVDYIASVFIHELLHLWFSDQYIDKSKVNTEGEVIKLAKKNPKKARKSAENYELYCLDLWQS